MKKFSDTTKRIISALCVLTLLLSTASIFSVSASAASPTQKFDCDRTVTFTVETGSKSPSIRFTSTVAPTTQGHRCGKAPTMAISVSPAVGGKSFFLISGNGKSLSSTLKLRKNETYTVRVSYYVNTRVNKCTRDDLTRINVHNIPDITRYRGFGGHDCYVNGSWSFTKISNCTVSGIRVK